jgi:4-hydroxy-tetrahydrodipicolinate synthase
MKNICEHAFAGEWEKARELHYTYFELFEALRLETNPMAVKEALALMGMPGGGFRPPLTPLSDSNKEKVKTLLRDRGLI